MGSYGFSESGAERRQRARTSGSVRWRRCLRGGSTRFNRSRADQIKSETGREPFSAARRGLQ